MGSAPSADAATTWLSRRLEFAPRDDEWEAFYSKNHEQVPSLEGPVDQVRQIMLNTKMRGQGKAVPINAGLSVEDITTEKGLKLRTYRPDGDTEKLPAMLYFHGGGFALGDLDGEDRTCRALCVGSQLVVVGVDYRLAPEHPYPAALDDSWEALEWVVQYAAELKVDTAKLLVGGTSAGANIAIVLAQQAPSRGVALHGQLLRIPVVCQSKEELLIRGLHSMDEMHDSPILSRGAMEQFLKWYNPPSITDPGVSPLLASASVLASVPRAFFQLCGRDPLRDEGLAYADALEAASVPIRVNVYSGVPHAFWIFPEISKTQVAAKDLISGVKWLLE
ncbi:hypothetical protein SEUCBS139899_006780 [Sporothrix eucalyptigena]|uniref:Alpha/beta hydrolase fold-3 domain-containing protein n=1 Tax=Sporothrix eucalyptigena TaxID=1812306 RepID=A0ABP0CVJ8_9PEZI